MPWGFMGDPVAAKAAIAQAIKTGVRVVDPYGYPRAFAYVPDKDDREWLQYEIRRLGLADATVIDPTAGGGTIPFESARLGFQTFANDINPVAALIIKATIEWPLHLHKKVYDEFSRISALWRERVEGLQSPFFSQNGAPDIIDTTYLWARIPLSPNWRLAPDGTGVRLDPQTAGGPNTPGRVCAFEIVSTIKEHSEGTVARGTATCPFPDCGRVVDGEAIKEQAQAGNIGEQLYAVVFKKRTVTTTKTGKKREKWERGYRAPRPEDDVSDRVKSVLKNKMPEWEALDIVPTEEFPKDGNDTRPIQYGMPLWHDFFRLANFCVMGPAYRPFENCWM